MKKFKRVLFLPFLIMGDLFMHNTSLSAQTDITPHWDAQLYKKNAVRLQLTSALELLSSLSVEPNTRFLDLGCGEGKVTAKIAEKVPEGFVEAVDLSQSMIELAQRDYGSVKNINFSQMDAERLEFKDPFDWVVSFFCLQWVRDKDQAFKQIANALKEGGKVALIMTNRNPHLLRIRNEMLQSERWKPYFESYEDPTNVIDDDKYMDYAQRAGLKSLRYTEKDKTVVFETRDELKAFIKMVSPAIKELPTEEQQDQFIEELTKNYIEQVPEEEGTKFYITYTLKTLLATK